MLPRVSSYFFYFCCSASVRTISTTLKKIKVIKETILAFVQRQKHPLRAAQLVGAPSPVCSLSFKFRAYPIHSSRVGIMYLWFSPVLHHLIIIIIIIISPGRKNPLE